MGRFVDMTGRRFGSWLVLRRVGKRGPHFTWLCRCDCGRRKEALGYHIRYGASARCRACANASTGEKCRRRLPDGTTYYDLASLSGLKVNTINQRFLRGWKRHELVLRPLARGERRSRS